MIEVGLGGRNDATNVIERVSGSAITSIGKDHENIIGPELSDIAYEKAGIIKPGVKNCVIGPTCLPFDIFRQTSDSLGCKLIEIGDPDRSYYKINKEIATEVIQNALFADGHNS